MLVKPHFTADGVVERMLPERGGLRRLGQFRLVL
jgi:hypothetical protein